MPNAPPPPAPLPAPAASEADEVRLLGGRARLLQARGGYRSGLDAALLAAAATPAPGAHALEIGCGAGGALVQAALRAPQGCFIGLERDPAALALARANLALNGLETRCRVLQADVDAGFSAAGVERVDAVFANPPFFDGEGAIRPPAPARRGAWIADGGLQAWTGFLLAAVRDGGAITVVHRADRLADLLALLSQKAGSFQVRGVHARAEAPAKRVLVRALRLGRAPLRLLPPLVLQGDDGAPAPLAAAILLGEAALEWEG